MAYFRFEIPKELCNGGYSPGWHGTMPHCPSDVEVLLYNDKEGYGIAKTPDKSLPKEVKEVTEKDAVALIESSKGEKVWKGKAVLERVGWLPEAEVKEDEVDAKTAELTRQPVVAQKAQFCPICHKFLTFLPESLKASKIIMVCDSGHKVAVNG